MERDRAAAPIASMVDRCSAAPTPDEPKAAVTVMDAEDVALAALAALGETAQQAAMVGSPRGVEAGEVPP